MCEHIILTFSAFVGIS